MTLLQLVWPIFETSADIHQMFVLCRILDDNVQLADQIGHFEDPSQVHTQVLALLSPLPTPALASRQISIALLHKRFHMLGANIALTMPGKKIPPYLLNILLRHFHQIPELRFVLGQGNPIDALEQFIALAGIDELIGSDAAETPAILQ